MQNQSASSDPRGEKQKADQDKTAFLTDASTNPALIVKGASDADAVLALPELSFHEKVSAGAFADVVRLQRQLPSLRDAIDEQTGLTPLCMAAMRGHADIAFFLLTAGAPVDALDHHGSTALMVAAQMGHAETVRLLLDYGANPNAINRQMSRSVLALAVIEKQFGVCQMLVEAGAFIHSTRMNVSENGQTASPLDIAIMQGCNEFTQWLFDTKRLFIESEIIKGTSLLHFACFAGSLKSVSFLLEAGASAKPNFDQRSDSIKGPLWSADANEQFHVVEYLLKRGMAAHKDIPSHSFPEGGFKYLKTIDLVNHADMLIHGSLSNPSGLKNVSLLQSPQKIIEGMADRKIDIVPKRKQWTHWLSELGVSTLISHEIFKRIRYSAVVFRALAGKHASTSRAQYLQALVEIVSEACASPNLNAAFSNINLTEPGEQTMNRMVHSQRALLLQAVSALREQHLAQLRTLPGVCINTYISTEHQFDEAGLSRFLTNQCGLYDFVAQAAIRLIKSAYEQVLREPASASAPPLNVQLRDALTSLLAAMNGRALMPEFGEALKEVGPHINRSMFGELIFAQWFMFNEAHQVEIVRPLMFGPIRSAAVYEAQ
jgi:ankyrin repeat protein